MQTATSFQSLQKRLASFLVRIPISSLCLKSLNEIFLSCSNFWYNGTLTQIEISQSSGSDATVEYEIYG